MRHERDVVVVVSLLAIGSIAFLRTVDEFVNQVDDLLLLLCVMNHAMVHSVRSPGHAMSKL